MSTDLASPPAIDAIAAPAFSVKFTRITPILIGIASPVLASLLVILLTMYLPPEWLGQSAANHPLRSSPAFIFFAAVVFAPLFETIIGQVLPIELIRRLSTRPWACIALSAAVFSLGHVANGAGLLHGLSTFLGGVMFGFVYVGMRHNGPLSAYLSAAIAHATHNAMMLYVIGPLVFLR